MSIAETLMWGGGGILLVAWVNFEELAKIAPEASKTWVQYYKDAEAPTGQTCNNRGHWLARNADPNKDMHRHPAHSRAPCSTASRGATSMDTKSDTFQARLATALLLLGLVAMGFSIF